ncbi:taste receptor type 2 member 9-like [Pelodytes ibericus]
MLDLMDVAMLIFDLISLLVGGIGDLLLFVTCVLEWSKQGCLNPYTIISFIMTISNVVMLCLQTVDQYKFMAYGEKQKDALLSFLSMTFLCYSLWCSTWICVFYCIKIVSYSLALYTWLQDKFHTLLPWLLFVSFTISLGIGLFVFFDFTENPLYNTSIVPANYNYKMELVCSRSYIVYSTFVSLSFVIASSSVIAIHTSLLRHVKHMQLNADGFRHSSLEVHYLAARTVTILLVFNVIFFLAQLISYVKQDVDWIFTISCIVIAISLSAWPYILMLGNTKMKLELQSIIQWFKCSNH